MKYITLILILIPLMLSAQEYSFEQLVNLGLKESYTAQSAELSMQTSESALSSARWNLLPEANLNAGADYRIYNPSPLPGASDLSSSFGIAISKVISLNDPNWYGYRNARLDREAAEIRQQSSLRAYVYQLFGSYIEVLNSEKQLRSLQENLRIQSRIWDQSKALFSQGKATTFEVKQNEIAVLNSQISILRMQNTIDKNRKNLFGLIGTMDEGYPLQELDLTPREELPALKLDSVEAIRLLEKEIDKNELSLRQINLDYFPKVSLSYSLSRSVSGADFDFDTYGTNHGVSLSLSYSLWNQFRHSETARRAKINRQMAQLSINEKKAEISREYASIIEELAYLRQLDELYSQKLDQAREQIRFAEQRYGLGMIQQLELDKTRSEYLDADIAYSTNQYQIIAKQETLNYLLSNQILGKW